MFERTIKPATLTSRDKNACMYTEYFKLNEPPFSLTPDPRYLFMSERHREGLAHLLYGVQQPGGFVQLTGEIGSGKTTLSRCLVRQLPHETDFALILNPRLTAVELLATVCDELRIPYPPETQSIKVLIDALNGHLLEAHARDKRTVLIIDEAQNLQSDVLEQVRLLTNLETSKEKLLQIILIGQPELLRLLESKELKQIAQRITARYHLLPLSRKETCAYIRHRLLVAGGKAPLFTDSAMRCVYRLSRGVPRLINILCDRALLGAYALDKRQVTATTVRRASWETRGTIPWFRRVRFAWLAALVALLAIVAGGVFYFQPASLRFWHGEASGFGNADAGSKAPRPTASKETQVTGETVRADAIEVFGMRASSVPSDRAVPKSPAGTKAASGPSKARFADLLSDPSQQAFSFSEMFSRWGIRPSTNPSEPGCKTAQAQGYECLFLVGNWLRIRRHDVPAILQIPLPNGERGRVTLVGLNGDTATLAIGGQEYHFSLSEIDTVWDGSFIIIWKPPFPPPYTIGPGSQGAGVVWVRKTLDALERKSPPLVVPDIYDDALRERILGFQRSQSLIQDGFVGHETLSRLALSLEGSNAPSLTKTIH